MKELNVYIKELILGKVNFYLFGTGSPDIDLYIMVHDEEFVIQATSVKAMVTILAKNLVDDSTWYEFIVEIGGYVVNHTKEMNEAFASYASLIQYQKEN